MDAAITKIQITPTKYKKDGSIEKPPSAQVVLDVPMISQDQWAALEDLKHFMDGRLIEVECGLQKNLNTGQIPPVDEVDDE